MSPVFLYVSVFLQSLGKQVHNASADFLTTRCWNWLPGPQKNCAVDPVQGRGIEQSYSKRTAIWWFLDKGSLGKKVFMISCQMAAL